MRAIRAIDRRRTIDAGVSDAVESDLHYTLAIN